ncbi:hypothetical protein CI793_09400 [Anoxybacillus ayderensis]|uniref:hypothetical protein n=1 Tax=Anoxybacillus sp. ST70 TaxID=2864180 RepID=UPI0010A07BDC|nr:hypothetical protein [Anoxybacillus sp. ST70]MBW9219371.1 hypothetical protein [Anoxybacillus sp. ST70]THD16117.1 hypothetical protein CI793_09400 [Anoxybacillus ayderensis]
MNWNAEIVLKTGKVVAVADLVSINRVSRSDSSVSKNTDFENFTLPSKGILSFVGKNHIVCLESSDIEYLSLFRVN